MEISAPNAAQKYGALYMKELQTMQKDKNLGIAIEAMMRFDITTSATMLLQYTPKQGAPPEEYAKHLFQVQLLAQRMKPSDVEMQYLARKGKAQTGAALLAAIKRMNHAYKTYKPSTAEQYANSIRTNIREIVSAWSSYREEIYPIKAK